ncbi:sulfite exporter TauE/SafE family protein [Bacillus horti]|uniref:Probable membrane transporter protein n=1 Tax=Caldalkalibacillus horti TaxID=77523 RepID=A0ABT9W413_9BACI|nr:sulfite exporter TauE/SafE family protein [Bacillus horti]MDQ0167822.1 putative membrane protein YfcA [Bacillus horti]
MFFAWIFLLGVVASTVGSLVGLGGGVFIVPVLLFLRPVVDELATITPQIAVGTSLVVVCFTALGSTLTYAKQKKVDFSSGLFFFLACGPGSMLGAFLNRGLNEQEFQLFFGFMMLLILYLLIRNKRIKPKNINWHVEKEYIDSNGKKHSYGYHRYIAFFICFFIGVAQGLLGIGGGALLVPALILLFWFPAHLAIATTMFIVLLASIAGSVSHFYLQNIDWLLVLILAPGALLGGQLGAFISSRLSSTRLTVLLKGMLLVIAVFSIWKGLSS